MVFSSTRLIRIIIVKGVLTMSIIVCVHGSPTGTPVIDYSFQGRSIDLEFKWCCFGIKHHTVTP